MLALKTQGRFSFEWSLRQKRKDDLILNGACAKNAGVI